MAQVKEFALLMELLLRRGLGNEWFSAEHDILYLPLHDENDPEMCALDDQEKVVGLHFDHDAESWAVFT